MGPRGSNSTHDVGHQCDCGRESPFQNQLHNNATGCTIPRAKRHDMYTRSVACSVTRMVSRSGGPDSQRDGELNNAQHDSTNAPAGSNLGVMTELERLRFLRSLSRSCTTVVSSHTELRTGLAAVLRPEAVRDRLDVAGLESLLSTEGAHAICR